MWLNLLRATGIVFLAYLAFVILVAVINIAKKHTEENKNLIPAAFLMEAPVLVLLYWLITI